MYTRFFAVHDVQGLCVAPKSIEAAHKQTLPVQEIGTIACVRTDLEKNGFSFSMYVEGRVAVAPSVHISLKAYLK